MGNILGKLILPLVLLLLGYGFWISPDFKEISAGVAVFLFGMLSLEEGFRVFSGGTLEKFLKKSTDKLYKSIGFGIITTTLMQSSSLVSVITISFLGAGLIGLHEGIGIIFGANIGTTTGAWLIAGFGLKVHISAYAMPMLVFGLILIFQKSKSLRGIGYILAGLGFLFLGIHFMKEGFEAFKSTIDLSKFAVPGFKGLLIFTGIGVFATVVMQSSHATLVLIITALSVGQITYENALALAIGANIGTTITAILGSLSSNVQGKRLAGAHLIFNVITGLIAIIFISQMKIAVEEISIFVGIPENEWTLKLAVFHTIFNVIGVTVMVPFINVLVNFLMNVFKDKEEPAKNFDHAMYLNESVLELPATAIASIRKEMQHLYENAFEIIAHGINVKRSNIRSDKNLDEVVAEVYSDEAINIDDFYQRKIKSVYGEMLNFAIRAQSKLSDEYGNEVYKLKLAGRDIVEAIKNTKHLQKNLVKYMNSENEDIKREYNKIRKDIAELLRTIDQVSKIDSEDEASILLSRAKILMEEQDVIVNNKLDNLIRENKITQEMATSLINDSTYAYGISRDLIAMAEILFMQSNEMVITEEEAEELV